MQIKLNISQNLNIESMIMIKNSNQSKSIFIPLFCLLLSSKISFCQQPDSSQTIPRLITGQKAIQAVQQPDSNQTIPRLSIGQKAIQVAQKPDSSKTIPISKIFYKLPHNVGGMITYNYGLNMLAAGVGTYALIRSNADWNLREFSNRNPGFAISGEPSVIIGGLAPIIAPVTLYLLGKKRANTKLQIVGLALGQAALVSFGVSSSMKAITGRKQPNDINAGIDNFSDDFKWGFFGRGIFHGWPSGHTTTAFAMAVTLIELYPENTTVKICALTYASVIGLGVSTDIHWFSDAFAGAFIGYAIGKSVGKSFNYLLKGTKTGESKLTFYPTNNGISITYKL